MDQFALTFRDVHKAYRGHAALAGVSFDVPAGALFGLVGVNGAGKTTLIKCLLDFARPDAGDIAIFGGAHRAQGARARLAFLPERFVPPHFLTGADFLRYMAALHGRPYDERSACEALAAVDLDARALALPVRAFSKGMTQKIGLAACLASGKDLLILDEPTSGLDPRARALLKRALAAQRDAGRTLFVTSHLLADVEELCDRMAVLHAGRVRFAGTPAELLATTSAADVETAFLACIGDDAAGARTP